MRQQSANASSVSSAANFFNRLDSGNTNTNGIQERSFDTNHGNSNGLTERTHSQTYANGNMKRQDSDRSRRDGQYPEGDATQYSDGVQSLNGHAFYNGHASPNGALAERNLNGSGSAPIYLGSSNDSQTEEPNVTNLQSSHNGLTNGHNGLTNGHSIARDPSGASYIESGNLFSELIRLANPLKLLLSKSWTFDYLIYEHTYLGPIYSESWWALQPLSLQSAWQDWLSAL